MKAKMMTHALLAIVSTGLTACGVTNQSASSASPSDGVDVTATFLKAYSGKFRESGYGETFQFTPDGRMINVQVRQVGFEGTEVPYPTVCSFAQVGTIRVLERSQADRAKYTDFATHVIETKIESVEFVEPFYADKIQGSSCGKFVEHQRNAIAQSGGLKYSIYTELLGPDSLRVHTSGGGDYKQGGVRTESTLDEVFERVIENREGTN